MSQAALPDDIAAQLAQAQAQGGGMPTQQNAAAAQQQKAEQEEARKEMLSQLLAPDAKERLSRISLVKPEKAKKLEEMVIQMARSGRLQKQLSDAQLKHMLEQISGGEDETKRNQIQFDRKRYDDDDSDIDLSEF
eukprot:CAMPEP_0119335176 /NCGR_PEP_ID=MMETSP1333-20130426/88917_1 /TAXON_ID=418940 /ORGANISM="Scyphosphaera apsteinii, Strain RCC1455" /LENGTH=134 /DNA_ID=CAMNT_0007345657 /DNA_START=20 /DNA_END=424 /DNA_ORIENTATION=-